MNLPTNAKYPLKATGAISHRGWDIPTLWTIDADNACWANEAHGGPQKAVSAKHLLNLAKKEGDVEEYDRISKVLGRNSSAICEHCNGTGHIMK